MTERPQQPEKEEKKATPKQPTKAPLATAATNVLNISPQPSPSPSSSPSPTQPSPLTPPPSSPSIPPAPSSSPPLTAARQKSAPTTTAKRHSAPARVTKKEEAVARGMSMPLSKKHCMALCRFIKNKNIDAALVNLEEVIAFKRAVPMKGEIPHRHGMMSARYPVTAAKHFIKLVKGLKGNILVNGLALDKTRIVWASASWASRQQKRGGARFKRTHVILKAREVGLPVKEKKQ